MNKFNKLYYDYIKKPTLTFENKEIDLCIKRDDFLYLLEYGKKLEQVLDEIKERHWKTRRNYVEDLTKLYDKLSEILEEIK